LSERVRLLKPNPFLLAAIVVGAIGNPIASFAGSNGMTRQWQQPVRPVQTLGLVAAAGHLDGTHQARSPAAKRPPRAHDLTLKKETTRPPGANSLEQQARFDAFVQEFNTASASTSPPSWPVRS
jgi:hypothetical protein